MSYAENHIIEIKSLDEEGIKVYSNLTDNELKRKGCNGIFIAESPKVIMTALDEGYEALSLLCERKHIYGDAAEIISRLPELRIYTGERDLLAGLTGYKLTRGVLCEMRRKEPADPRSICKDAKRIAVLEGVCDTTNIGSIFRSAAALGIDGILLTPDSCNPFNRRSIRVSMGSVFKIPWAMCERPIDLLKENGFITIALALDEDSEPINSLELKSYDKIAMILGTEGDGLSQKIIKDCDYKAVIPMSHGVDSLNVGAAAAVAFWELK